LKRRQPEEPAVDAASQCRRLSIEKFPEVSFLVSTKKYFGNGHQVLQTVLWKEIQMENSGGKHCRIFTYGGDFSGF
jgi:hypothetical protein